QPIVDIVDGTAFAYEALVRGPSGEGAWSVLSQVSEANRYAFDQQCRVKAIETATRVGLVGTGARLSINFLPNAVYSPAACMELIRAIDSSLPRRMIVDALVKMCTALGVTVIAEGIETAGELEALRALGVRYIQGFHFARPAFEALPAFSFEAPGERRTG